MNTMSITSVLAGSRSKDCKEREPIHIWNQTGHSAVFRTDSTISVWYIQAWSRQWYVPGEYWNERGGHPCECGDE